MKVLPKGVEIDRENLRESIASHLPSNMSVRSVKEEPIAFGLVALILDIQFEDKENVMDEIESIIKNVDDVSQIQVLAVSKLSTRM